MQSNGAAITLSGSDSGQISKTWIRYIPKFICSFSRVVSRYAFRQHVTTRYPGLLNFLLSFFRNNVNVCCGILLSSVLCTCAATVVCPSQSDLQCSPSCPVWSLTARMLFLRMTDKQPSIASRSQQSYCTSKFQRHIIMYREDQNTGLFFHRFCNSHFRHFQRTAIICLLIAYTLSDDSSINLDSKCVFERAVVKVRRSALEFRSIPSSFLAEFRSYVTVFFSWRARG